MTRALSVRALFFDADGVLYHRPAPDIRLRAFLERHALPLPSDERISTAVATVAEPAKRGAIPRDALFDVILAARGVAENGLLPEGRAALAADAGDVILYEGVSSTLHVLRKRGFMLGVVTDSVSPSAEKLRWVRAAGLDIRWDTFADSCEVGACKPDPRIYRAARDACGVAASESVFVGHKASELAGARALGMATVAVYYDADAVADRYIRQFADLLVLPFLGKPS